MECDSRTGGARNIRDLGAKLWSTGHLTSIQKGTVILRYHRNTSHPEVVSKDLHELMPAICQALAEDETRRSLRLSFAKSLKFRDTDLVALARALPALTGLLRLDLRSCRQLSDAAVLELAGALKRVKVTALFLDFFMCAGLTDLSIAQIFANSQHLTDMREFDLNVRGLVKADVRLAHTSGSNL